MKALPLLLSLSLAFAGLTSVRSEEIVLHAGPSFTTPGLGLKLDSGEIVIFQPLPCLFH